MLGEFLEQSPNSVALRDQNLCILRASTRLSQASEIVSTLKTQSELLALAAAEYE